MMVVATGSDDGTVALPSTVISADSRSPHATSEAEQSGAAENAEVEAVTVALPRVLKTVGTIAAPTTALTALLFHFGFMYAIGYFQYFGVNWTVLNLPVQQYLILSVSSGLIPLLCVAGGMLLAVWLYQLPLDTLPSRAQWIIRRLLMPVITIAGLFLLTVAMVDPWHPLLGMKLPLESRGISLSLGVLLVAYACRLRRVLTTKRQPAQSSQHVPVVLVVAQWGAVFLLFCVGLFWAVSSYAVNAGDTEARSLAADLSCETDVVVYSEKSLNLHAPGVQAAKTDQNSDAAYPYRYDGLKLVPQSGNMYLLLPVSWTRAAGVAIVLPRSDKLRMEFSQPAGMRNGTC
ncbi:MAG: hypothetical protein WCC38_16360 [Pseudonocardiaceae bacterium]